MFYLPVSSDRQRLSYGGCLEVKKARTLSELLGAVFCTTVVHNGMHTDMSSS